MKILYIDAGGTKTAGYLVDNKNKKIISSYLTGSGNINTNYELATHNILTNINFFNSQFDKILVGAAGAFSNPSNKNKLLTEVKKICLETEVYSDLELLAKLTINQDSKSLLLILGTGSAALTYSDNQYQIIMGWGKLVYELGSGFDIGLNLIKYFCWLEDNKKSNYFYQKFLSDFQFTKIRDFIPKLNIEQFADLTKWVVSSGEKAINTFIIPRIKKVFDYLNFIDFNKVYCTGSIFLKINQVQEFSKSYLKNKTVEFISFESAIIK